MENLQLQLSAGNLFAGIVSSFIGTLLAITWVRAYRRFSIRKKKKKNDYTTPDIPLPLPVPYSPEIQENPLWLKLEKVMAEHELWRDPDLTASMMVNRMHTNRTSFSNAIKDGGYDNFYDYLAHYRIQAFCQKADMEDIENLQDAFFEVGYKARTTAFNQFKKIKGMSPSEYIKLKKPIL